MNDLDEILAELRTATTAEQYANCIERLNEQATYRAEVRSRMEADEEKAIFAGEDPSAARATLRQLDDELRTIEVALAGAERRQAAASIREDAEEMSELGDVVLNLSMTLGDEFAVIRRLVLEARKHVARAAEITRKIEGHNGVLAQAGRPDLVKNTAKVRNEAMRGPVEAENIRLPAALRVLDRDLLSLATGGRVWRRDASVVARTGRESFVSAAKAVA